MKGSESRENLVAKDSDKEGSSSASKSPHKQSGAPKSPAKNAALMKTRTSLAPKPAERPLTRLEKEFLLYVVRGDHIAVRNHVKEHLGKPDFDINCMDPLNRTALVTAIDSENYDIMSIVLEAGADMKDALLHAIKEEYVDAVDLLLEREETTHKPGTRYSWETVDPDLAAFTPDITPLMLAAHKNNYEIIKILLDRGATLPTPHDVRCACDDCLSSIADDSLRHSQARINAYRALSSPSLIALSSRDPLITAFELSHELKRLSNAETEFREDYNAMRKQVQDFTKGLLDHARTSDELDTILNHDPENPLPVWDNDERSLTRLKLAIEYRQKGFVAHPSVQQLLSSMWYDGLPGFRRKGMVGQVVDVAKIAASFPVNSVTALMSPNSSTGKLMKKPFVKFISQTASYLVFLTLLCGASQRIEYLVMDWFGNDWMHEMLEDWKRRERGCLPGLFEFAIIMYVGSLLIWEMQSLWNDGILDYVSNLWNIIDFAANVCYVNWIALRALAYFISWREWLDGWDPYYPRENWDMFDPMLVSEGMFAAGMVMSFLKMVNIFSINPYMGPLQISLGRMIVDIIKFFFIYTLVLFAFGCGLNNMMWYYSELEREMCYHGGRITADYHDADKQCEAWRRFSNLFETSQSLFWASFGLVDLVAFDLEGIKGFTRFWALLMFGSYSVINIIVLLNLLIAMMSNSYQIISERADEEWKFARSKLFISFFDETGVIPPPFNVFGFLRLGRTKRGVSSHFRSREELQEEHDRVSRLLVKRFVMAEQCNDDDFTISEDDILEVRSDISSLRCEIIELFRSNNMVAPDADADKKAGKKGKVLERRLMQDFKIGWVENVVQDAVRQTSIRNKDVFGVIAKAIKGGNKANESKKWNEVARQRNSQRDHIGSTKRQSLRRAEPPSLENYMKETDKVDPAMLAKINPNLKGVAPHTRLAYAKFKTLQKSPTLHEVDEEKNKTIPRPKPAEPAKVTESKQNAPAPDKNLAPAQTAGAAKQASPSKQAAPAPPAGQQAKPAAEPKKPEPKKDEVVVNMEPSKATPAPAKATPPAAKPAATPTPAQTAASKPTEPPKPAAAAAAQPAKPARPVQEKKATELDTAGKGKSVVTGKTVGGWL